MPGTTKKPMPTIGVDKYTFFPVTSDDSTGIVYGEAVSLPGTVEIAPTDTGGSDVFDADNGAYAGGSYIESMGHELTNADIPPSVEAAWRGLTLKNGGVEVGGEQKTVYFGCAWRLLKKDGTYRYVRYYKGTYAFASNVGGVTKPSSGAPENRTATATFTAVKCDYNDAYLWYIDEADLPAGVEKATFEEEFFSDLTYYPSAE